MDKSIRLRDELIKEYRGLVQLFDNWVALVKKNDLEGAKGVKDLANISRLHVKELEKQIQEEKMSRIIKLNN